MNYIIKGLKAREFVSLEQAFSIGMRLQEVTNSLSDKLNDQGGAAAFGHQKIIQILSIQMIEFLSC